MGLCCLIRAPGIITGNEQNDLISQLLCLIIFNSILIYKGGSVVFKHLFLVIIFAESGSSSTTQQVDMLPYSLYDTFGLTGLENSDQFFSFFSQILMEADRALAVLRRALKKDRGNVHLYHHVFDICYQRQPLDCQGVLASVLLALASKELSIHDKYWFAYKRVEFLREHGDIEG